MLLNLYNKGKTSKAIELSSDITAIVTSKEEVLIILDGITDNRKIEKDFYALINLFAENEVVSIIKIEKKDDLLQAGIVITYNHNPDFKLGLCKLSK